MKTLLGLLTVSMVVGFASPAFADEAAHPCREVHEACSAAGFVRGKDAPAGKNIFKDCIRPIAEGKTVAGVNVSPDVVKACKAKHAERRARRGAGQAESSK